MNAKLLIALATTTVATTSMAQIEIYAGTLSGLQEVPQNNSTGTGSTLVTIDIGGSTMRIQTSFSGMLGNVTNSHIHFGSGPGTNGGVATTTPTFLDFPSGGTSGTYDRTFDMTLASSYNPAFVTANGGTTASAWSAFVSRMQAGHGYHNIHSTMFSGGEIRADLSLVPEPSAVFAIGLGLVAFAARRRRTA